MDIRFCNALVFFLVLWGMSPKAFGLFDGIAASFGNRGNEDILATSIGCGRSNNIQYFSRLAGLEIGLRREHHNLGKELGIYGMPVIHVQEDFAIRSFYLGRMQCY